MPWAPARPCVEPRCPALVRRGSRCPAHRRQHEQRRGGSTARGYDYHWQRLVAEAIRQQPWCSDCGHTGSPDNPLTGDHVAALSRGGASAQANVVVRCRACNSRKGARS